MNDRVRHLYRFMLIPGYNVIISDQLRSLDEDMFNRRHLRKVT